MPLESGGGDAIGHNISELMKSGRSQKQSEAIALDEARKTGGGKDAGPEPKKSVGVKREGDAKVGVKKGSGD